MFRRKYIRRFDYLQRMANGGRGQAVELTWMMMFVMRTMMTTTTMVMMLMNTMISVMSRIETWAKVAGQAKVTKSMSDTCDCNDININIKINHINTNIDTNINFNTNNNINNVNIGRVININASKNAIFMIFIV